MPISQNRAGSLNGSGIKSVQRGSLYADGILRDTIISRVNMAKAEFRVISATDTNVQVYLADSVTIKSIANPSSNVYWELTESY